MGEPNNALNMYMRKPERIQSVLEYYLGEKLPKDWRFLPEEGFYSTRNAKGKLSYRQRDHIKKVQTCSCSFYLGLENQETVNLTFPWRLMEMDTLTYRTDIEEIQEKNRTTKAVYKKGDDFKYSYLKGDRLLPVLNLTLYWGKRKWERPLSLRDMVEMDDTLWEKLKGMFNDYRVHLIHMRSIPEEALQEMDSDLRYVLGLMRREGEGEEFEEYVRENKDYFGKIPTSAVDVLDVCMNIKDIKSRLKYILNPETGEEEADMCKALNDIKKSAERRGREEGIAQGMEQGIAQGIEQGITQGVEQGIELGIAQGIGQGKEQGESLLGALIQKLLSDGRLEDAQFAATDKAARNRLYQECGIVNV